MRRTLLGVLVCGVTVVGMTAAFRAVPAAGQAVGPAQKGRFIDHGEYVEDLQTGLLWQKDGAASGKLNFHGAAKYAKDLKLGNLTGWRVPTRKELAAIFPATDAPFRNTKYTEQPCCNGPFEWNSYWTCELDPRLNDYAWVYQWYHRGGANNCYASKNFVYVRCVHDSVTRRVGTETPPPAVEPKQSK